MIEKSEWERRYGMDTDFLRREVLSAAIRPTPTPWVKPTPRATRVPPTPMPAPVVRPIPTRTPVPPPSLPPGTWARSDDRRRIHIEVLSYDPDGWPEIVAENRYNLPPRAGNRYALITIRVRNLEPDPLFPDISTVELQAGGRRFTSYSQASRCGRIPNDLHSVIWDTFHDTKIPGGQAAVGTICFQIPESLGNLSLVPNNFHWFGDAIRVGG